MSPDSLLEPRTAAQGCSLRHAHRPRTHDDLARMLAQHACRACGRGARAGRWASEPSAHRLDGVVYCTLEHACACGFAMPVFVVLNDVLRSAGQPCAPAEAALAELEPRLPPDELERGLATVRTLLHRGDAGEAVAVAEDLARRFGERAECHFNAGCARQRLGDRPAALAHYGRSLERHPQLAEAWNNRGVILQQLGRAEEARFCLARAHLARGTPAPPSGTARVLEQAPGVFDVLRVVEDEDVRALFIGSQCQGAAYRRTDDDEPEPGPFACSAFTTGWLLAASRFPRGRGLMLGLGSGAGAIQLLACFPALSLRVLEIDAGVIELSRRCFPRLARGCDEGRLELVHADAREELDPAADGPRYDFALLDLFAGSPDSPLLADPRLLVGLGRRTEVVLANAIFTLGDEAHRAWLAAFAAAGRPVARMYPLGAPERWRSQPHNWILSTTAIEPPPGFAPFAASSHYLAAACRHDFRSMCDRAISP